MTRPRPRRSVLRLLAAIGALGAVTALALPAAAERLITSLSEFRVMVTSSFVGDTVVLFGAIERDGATVSRRGGFDIVVTVTGPRQTVVTRRKERAFGIWVNVDSRVFVEAPSYLAFLSNRPIDQIADSETSRRLQLGLTNFLLPQKIGEDTADVVARDPFRSAFVRLKQEQQLYRVTPAGVTFLAPNLFRAEIKLPAEVPIGPYTVDVKLFADGAMIARTNTAFEIFKAGFEQFVATAAHTHGLLYGLATSMMAMLTGWLAAVAFRRD